jgi:glycosyltransferase involved in cell wall biosynthesis
VGGLFRHVLDLAGEEAARGHDVGIIADSTTADALTASRLAAIEPHLRLGLHLIPMSRRPGAGDIAAALATQRIARRTKAGILHGHGAKGGAFARLAAAALKATGRRVRCFYTPHGGSLHFDPRSAEGRIYLTLEKVLGRVTDGLIFESQFSKRVYAERIGLAGVPARVVPNGLAPADFALHEPAPDAAELLFVGELRHLKGVDVLIEAVAQLSRTRPLRAVIVGAGPDAEAFKTLVIERGLADRVSFPGAMPARAAFSRGRVLVVPSRAESFPYIVLEAAAAGLTLVATEVGGIPEIVAGTSTSLVPPGDAGALAAAIAQALDDPGAARAKALALREAVSRRFTVDAMTTAILLFQAEEAHAAEPVLGLTQT